MYRVFNWYIKELAYYQTLPYEKEGEVISYLGTSCGRIQGVSGESTTNSYFFNTTEVYSQCSFYANIAVVTTNPVNLILDNGTQRFVATVTNTGVTLGDYTYELDATTFHNYILTTNGTSALLFVDNVLVGSVDRGSTSTGIGCYIGFENALTDNSALYIKNLGTTEGFKLPLDLNSLQFELQVDSADTFDSINLKTYTNGSGEDANNLTCQQTGEVIVGGASGTKLGRSFTIPTPPRQTDKPYFYFYRVRPIYNILGTDEVEYGPWSYYMFDEPDNIFIFATKDSMKIVSNMEEGIVAFCEEDRKSYIFKKSTISEPPITVEGYNDGEVVVNVRSTVSDDNGNISLNLEQIHPRDEGGHVSLIEETIPCTISGGYWKETLNSYFMLDTNVRDAIFDSTNYRLPSEAVYTRYNKSGNIANLLMVEAQLEDKVRYQIIETIRDLRIQSARESVLPSVYGTKYNLDPDYFDDNLMYRYALMDIQNWYREPGRYKGIVDIFTTITGVKPIIKEYLNEPGWLIYSEQDMFGMDADQIYHLDDEDSKYPEYKTAVLYSDEERAFSFDIEIFNPYNIKLTESMVKEIVNDYKPAATLGNIIMHYSNGREYQYPGYYYFGHYGNALYYPKSEGFK